ncbi:unnamed protein product [Amoebophrya sp. A120]|nr:unnamed protein product [Amoebophrya sp. A120]|eukprot:GSA120T00025340001.1
MVVVERYEKTAADPEAAYRAGTIIRVKWPHTDGTKGWYTAMITGVSERISPVRKRSTPSHYRYTLMWADGSRSLASRLLHLKHKIRYQPHQDKRCNLRAFVHCSDGKRHELPLGVSYTQPTSRCTVHSAPRLKVVSPTTISQMSRWASITLPQYPTGKAAVDVANRKRLGFILDHLHKQRRRGDQE